MPPPRGGGPGIDRWVWYAGWADKITQVLGTVNPVNAPYFNFTFPEPTGSSASSRRRRRRCWAS